MKLIQISIIAVLVIVIFASSNAVLGTNRIFPVAKYDETYKINTQAAWKDWSPTSNILVASINGSLVEYAGNGTELGILYQNQHFSITNIRFNHDGTKIAFLNDYTSSELPLDIYILDLKNNQLSQLTHGAHVQGLAWTPDGNIIYAENDPKNYFHFKILKLDLKHNSTSVILDKTFEFYGFDISPDGKKLVLSQNYTACYSNQFGCNLRLFIYDLESGNKTLTQLTKENSTAAGPRWSYDRSFITYEYVNYPCGPINAITPDGRNTTTLIWNNVTGSASSCNELAVVNKDGSIIAYDSDLGTSDGGMFFTYTDRCAINSCQFPIPEFPVSLIVLATSIAGLIIVGRLVQENL